MLGRLMFPIVYIPPLQSSDLHSSIKRLQTSANWTLLQCRHFYDLRRFNLLSHHYILGQVENPVSVDFHPKLGHRLTLILHEVPETDSAKAKVQVQLFDIYATLADCIKDGNLIMLTGARVDISMMCRPNQRIPHLQLQVTAKPQFQKNFKLFFISVGIDISLPMDDLKVTSVSTSKCMEISVGQKCVNVLGVITGSTPFEKVNAKEWRCFITLADPSVDHQSLSECCLPNSSLLIKVVTSSCLNAFKNGHILRILHLQITEQNGAILGLMETECQSVLFHVSPEDLISVLPLHSQSRIHSIEWQKVKEIFCWWTAVGKLENECNGLPNYLLTKGFLTKIPDGLDKGVSLQAEGVKGSAEQMLSCFPSPRKRSNPEGCDGATNLNEAEMKITNANPAKISTSNFVPSMKMGKIIRKKRSKSTISHANRVDNDKITPVHAKLDDCSKELMHADEASCRKELPVVLEEQRNNPKNVRKLTQLAELDHDGYYDIDCQVVGCYIAESFDTIVLKVWDGSKCPYINKSNVSAVLLYKKFEDPNLADIDDYCVNVNVLGIYMQETEVIMCFDFVKLQNVRADAGILKVPGWYFKYRAITVYDVNALKDLDYKLNFLRRKLAKDEQSLNDSLPCMTSNPHPKMCNEPSTGKENTLSICDAFTPFETLKQGFMSKETTGAIFNTGIPYNTDSAKTNSLKLWPDIVKGSVEYTTANFGVPTIGPQNKQLQPTLSVIGQEDMFFDIFCQVVGCYHNVQPLKVILKIWDGTKCKHAKCLPRYDSWTTVFEDPHIDDIDDYCIFVNVYDEYMEMTRALKLFDILKLCNVRARGGVFAMNGGRIKQRKILICLPNSTVTKLFSVKLENFRKGLGKNEKEDVDARSIQDIVQPVSIMMHADNSSNNQNSCQVSKLCTNTSAAVDSASKIPVENVKHNSTARISCVDELSQKKPFKEHCKEMTADEFFRRIFCANPVKECQTRPSSVDRIKRSPVPGKFCFVGAVIDIHPRANEVSKLIKWFCTSCQNLVSSKDLKDLKDLGHYKYRCPCNNRNGATNVRQSTSDMTNVLEPIFVLRLTVCDHSYKKLQIRVDGPHAATFFRNYSPVEFLKHHDVREQFAALFRSLCNQPNCLTKSSFALHCHLYSCKDKDGNTFYTIVQTQLIPFQEITSQNR